METSDPAVASEINTDVFNVDMFDEISTPPEETSSDAITKRLILTGTSKLRYTFIGTG